jgi:hypothetical protein
MAKLKRTAPSWWNKHKKLIWDERQQKSLKKQKQYEDKSVSMLKTRDSWKQYQNKQMQIELARLFQNTRSASELMRLENNRTEMILTFTLSRPYRVEDTDKSFNAVMDRIITQANSLMFYIRKLSKSTRFKSSEPKECRYKKRLHYHWALELQTSGDVHMHIVVSIYDDIEELIRLIHLVHELRNRYLYPFFTGKDNQTEIYPMGRTHFALSSHLKDDLFAYYKSIETQIVSMSDKEDNTRMNYFLPTLSPQINIYTGKGTILEFSDNKTMAKKYDKLRKYIISMTRAKFKLKTVQTAASDSQRIHNLKGKFEGDETRAAEDVAVFEYLGLKLHSSSEMLFSKSLYQKIRKQLISHKKKYSSLAQVTIDCCKGLLVIEGKSPERIILYRNEIVAIEPRKHKLQIVMSPNEINSYKLAKEGL